MMMPDNPWDGLVAGGKDARRVANCRHDFFWVVSGNSEPGLLLRLAPETTEIRPLPKMRNLDIAYREVAARPSLVILLKDGEQHELFAGLCDDIVRAGEAASDNQDALSRAIRRTLRWHHLLRGGRTEQLSLEEQRGLIGELQFLTHLIDLVGPRAAIEAWKGPAGSSKDFELDGCLVEVKARRGAAKPFVQVSSEDQLTDVGGSRLFLVVSPVDAVVKPDGKTLTDHVAELDKLFAVADPDACALWEAAIAETGFDFGDDYSDRRWVIGKSLHFEVRDGFPRIALPLAIGVSGVRYSIGLDACAPFSVEADVIDQLIVERNGSWTN
ncbi:PD-(D/E)XK motif protein [Novosphingobium sp. NPDC080210]|uniref:PD-(D/E)XK motif protein n=1 Tax=Novosphingobium sp. NPDC080210 TaxID=3390596 RepID=UPI003CFD983A